MTTVGTGPGWRIREYQAPAARVFYISVTSQDIATVVDAPMRRYMFTRGPAYCVINAEASGYAAYVAQLKAEFPDVKVLRYYHSQRLTESTKIGSTGFAHLLATPAYGLLKKNGSVKVLGTAPRRTAWADITNPDFRAWYVSHLVTELAASGCDGLFGDNFHGELIPSNPYEDGDTIAAAWLQAAKDFLTELRAACPAGTILGFNGLWNNQYDGQVAAQASILADYADFATCEHYGHIAINAPYDPDEPFDEFVLRINTEIRALPDKLIAVHGTTPDAYYDYLEHLRNARYTYACYLLARTPNSSFFYSQDYQMTRLARSRSGGQAMQTYLDLNLGEPVADAVESAGGGWSREFENGIAYVAPEGGDLQTWQTPFRAFSPNATLYPAGTTISLLSDDALILVKQNPGFPGPLTATLSDSSTEWLLEMESGEFRYRTLELWISSTSKASLFELRAEVNDDPRPYGILEIGPFGATTALGTKDEPYLQTSTQNATHVRARQVYSTDGRVNKLIINLADAFGDLEHFRVASAKVSGATVHKMVLRGAERVVPLANLSAPIAFFSHDVNELEVTFTDASLGADIVSYSWDFGDGETSTTQSPVHTYATATAMVVTLTVTDSEGFSNSYFQTVRPSIAAGGPTNVQIPTTLADFVAIGLAPPTHSYPGDIASGDLKDQIGSLNLTNNLVTSFQAPVPVTGWDVVGAEFTGVASQHFAVDTGVGEDPATEPSMWVAMVYLGAAPGNSRGIMSLGTTFYLRQLLTDGRFQMNVGGDTESGQTQYVNDVYLVGIRNDPDLAECSFETNINTPDGPAPVYTAPTDGLKGFGGILGGTSTSFTGILIHGWVWTGADMPTFNEVATALRWVEEAPEDEES